MFCLTTRLGRSAVAGALFVTLSVAVPSRVSAADHQTSEADNQLEMKAREQFASGRYDEAIDTFAKLYAKSLNPVYMRNIGRCYQKKREPQKAIDQFQDYLAKTKSGKNKISADERAEIEGYIKEMEALRDEQARAAAVPAPVVPLTAAPVTAAPPPAPAPTDNPPAAMLTSAPQPAEESHPIYTRWWFWTAIGVVVAGGVVAAVALSGGTSKPNCTAPGGCL
jgi:hypothetical protein